MYQLEINTPLGTILSCSLTESQIKEIVLNLDKSTQISMVTEKGHTVYMTSDMIGRSVLFVRSIPAS